MHSPSWSFIIKYSHSTGKLNYSVIFMGMFFPHWWLTCGDQSELVLLVCHLLLLHVPPREEESHHPLEELVHQLDGEWHHVHLTEQTSHFFFFSKSPEDCDRSRRDAASPQSVPSRRFLPQGGALCWRCGGRTDARTDSCSGGGAPPETRRRDGYILKSLNQ